MMKDELVTMVGLKWDFGCVWKNNGSEYLELITFLWHIIKLGQLTCLFLGTPSQALLAVKVVRMSQFVRDKTLICKSSGVA